MNDDMQRVSEPRTAEECSMTGYNAQDMATQGAAQEAVAWQRRFIGATRGGIPSQWHNLTKEEFEQCRAGKWSDRYEFRKLYAAPVAAAPRWG